MTLALPGPRAKLKKLTQRAMISADKASKYLAEEGVDELVRRLPEMEDKQFISGLGYLERISLQRQQVAKAAGLSKNGSGSVGPGTVINVSIRADLPLQERIKLIEAEVNGVPLVEAVVVVPAALPGPEPVQALETQPVPAQTLLERIEDL